MNDLNWWLMTLAFVLGLLLTFAMMIRRVTREVPVNHAFSARVEVPTSAKSDLKSDLKADLGKVSAAGAAVAAGAASKLTGAAEKVAEAAEQAVDKIEGLLEKDPYGPGSLRLAAGAVPPAGYTIKGNADSMLFHGPDSPSYEQTIAEVWFFDEATARAAGFDKWDRNLK